MGSVILKKRGDNATLADKRITEVGILKVLSMDIFYESKCVKSFLGMLIRKPMFASWGMASY